jgi:hypothetical protein
MSVFSHRPAWNECGQCIKSCSGKPGQAVGRVLDNAISTRAYPVLLLSNPFVGLRNVWDFFECTAWFRMTVFARIPCIMYSSTGYSFPGRTNSQFRRYATETTPLQAIMRPLRKHLCLQDQWDFEDQQTKEVVSKDISEREGVPGTNRKGVGEGLGRFE